MRDLFVGASTEIDAQITHFPILLRLLNAADLIGPVILLIGVLSIGLPQVRAWRLQWRFRLKELPETTPARREICASVHEHALIFMYAGIWRL